MTDATRADEIVKAAGDPAGRESLPEEIKDAVGEVKRIAESSGSESRQDIEQEDGSVVKVTCRAGEDPVVAVADDMTPA